jgi:putative oxidoreductase
MNNSFFHNPGFTNAGALIGRILIALIFVISGFTKIGGFEGVVGYIASKGLPMPQIAAAFTVALELGGGILLIIGWQTRWVALIYFIWLLPVTFVFHKFWGIDAAQVQNQFINFMKNVSIMGAMWMLMSFGPGRYSLDKR